MMTVPPVTDAAALDDSTQFDAHPGRRYRRRPGAEGTVWVIRRRGRDVYLRTLAQTAILCPDNDEALRQLWFEAGPDLDPAARELIQAARQAERSSQRPAKAVRLRRATPRRLTKPHRGIS